LGIGWKFYRILSLRLLGKFSDWWKIIGGPGANMSGWLALPVSFMFVFVLAFAATRLTRTSRKFAVARARFLTFLSYAMPIVAMFDFQRIFLQLMRGISNSWYVTENLGGWATKAELVEVLNGNRVASFVFPFFCAILYGERVMLTLFTMLMHLASTFMAAEHGFIPVSSQCVIYAAAVVGKWKYERQKKRWYFLLFQTTRAVEELTTSKQNFVSAL
jgi:hypothetical protein